MINVNNNCRCLDILRCTHWIVSRRAAGNTQRRCCWLETMMTEWFLFTHSSSLLSSSTNLVLLTFRSEPSLQQSVTLIDRTCGFSRHAEEFAIFRRIWCLPRKNMELLIFATLTSNSWFFWLLCNFTVYKTIKSSRFKLTFMIIVSTGIMTWLTWYAWMVLIWTIIMSCFRVILWSVVS